MVLSEINLANFWDRADANLFGLEVTQRSAHGQALGATTLHLDTLASVIGFLVDLSTHALDAQLFSLVIRLVILRHHHRLDVSVYIFADHYAAVTHPTYLELVFLGIDYRNGCCGSTLVGAPVARFVVGFVQNLFQLGFSLVECLPDGFMYVPLLFLIVIFSFMLQILEQLERDVGRGDV